MLSVHFGVSVRKIKYLVKEINEEAPYILSSRQGYKSNPELKEEIQKLVMDAKDGVETPKERENKLLRKLIQEDEGIELYELSDAIYINPTTLRQEILHTKKFLEKYHLELKTERNRYFVQGTEKQKRKAMSALLMREASKGMILRYALQEMFSETEEEKVRVIMRRNLEKTGLYINDFAFLNLQIHLLVMMVRNRSGKELMPTAQAKWEVSQKVQAYTEAVFRELDTECGFSAQQWEQQDFALLVESQTQSFENEEEQEAVYSLVGPQIYELLQKIKSRIRAEYYIDLGESPFLTRFALHLKNLILRVETEGSCYNPYTEYMKLSCPLIYEVCVCIADCIYDYTGKHINDNEIAFLALHLGTMFENQDDRNGTVSAVLFCPEYHELTEWMATQLESKTQDKLSVRRIVHSEEELEPVAEELIFSTIALKEHYRQNVIYITPLLGSADIRNVQNALACCKRQREQEKARALFDSLFTESMFHSITGEMGQQELLTQMCREMETEGYVDGGYYEKVMKREQLSPTVYGKIAIPHSLKACALRSGIGVCLCEKPVSWDGRSVSVVMLIAIHPAEQLAFNELWDKITQILSNDEIIGKIMKCRTYPEFIDCLVAGIE